MDFPKRYKVEYIQQLQRIYQYNHPHEVNAFSIFVLPAVQPLHLGHFYGLYLKDFFLKAMESKKTMGLQHGIIFQWKSLYSVYEAQQFFAKRNQTLPEVGTAKLCRYLYAQKEKGTKINKKLLSLYFGDFIEAFEEHPDFSQFAQDTFRNLWDAGKIHIKKNIAYWSVDLQTTIHHHHTFFKPVQGKNYTVKYFIEAKGDVLLACARIPDMIFGDVALLVHPQDKRYKKLIGKKAIIPVVNRTIPIIGDTSVDISKDNGIKRVCPCSDFESIALAEKHGLPLDHYVFDKEGRYTAYAGEYEGKLRKDFYPNILQYLEDISNLGVIYEEPSTVPYYIHSQEELYPLLVNEIVVDIEEEKRILAHDLQHDPIWEPIKDKLLEALPGFTYVLNRQIPRGTHIPLMKVGDEYRLENAASFFKRTDVDEVQSCFDYLVFCLARDQYLSTSVASITYDTLFNVFSQSTHAIQGYLEVLPHKGKKMEKAVIAMEDILAQLPSNEKIVEKFETLIQNSACLHKTGEFLQITLPSGEEVEFLGETFDNECLAALSPVFLTWYGMQLDPAIFVEEGKTYLFLHELILQQLILKKYVYTSLIQYPSLLSPKGERFSYGTVRTNQIFNLLDEYGPSPVRLSLLIQQSLDVNVINRYDAFLRQIRNGVRYLVLSVSDHRTTSDEAWEKFNNNADHLDIWLMTEFYEMWHAYKKVTDYQLLIDNFPMIQEFIQKKLLGWYLEAKKSDESGERNMTCFIVFSGILTLLYPFVPGYVRAMLQTLEFPYQEFIARPFEKESSFQAKWVYELFDMLYTFRLKLGIKKHQKIAIFFKADPNSLQLFEEYQQLLQKIVNIEQVILLRLHEADPTGYQQETYNGITIGIKVLHQSPSIRKPILADLEQQYAQQLEYFEYLRTVIANMSAYTFMDIETDQIRQKKAEMEKVKLHLEHLQLAIQKLKVR